jgi:hypothetical protein
MLEIMKSPSEYIIAMLRL